MKDIKEYLKYYLGCEVSYCQEPRQKYYLESLQQYGLKHNGKGAFIMHDADDSHWVDTDEIKPILRKLESMTEGEASECWRLLEWNARINPANRASELIGEFSTIEEDNGTTNNAHWGYFLKILPYLLSHGFDLFNLIENGLAIDKETLKV